MASIGWDYVIEGRPAGGVSWVIRYDGRVWLRGLAPDHDTAWLDVAAAIPDSYERPAGTRRPPPPWPAVDVLEEQGGSRASGNGGRGRAAGGRRGGHE